MKISYSSYYTFKKIKYQVSVLKNITGVNMNERINKAKFIAKKIKTLRSASKMSQYQLAEISGITASAISQIESGNRIPSLIVGRKIANALHISISELTGDNALPSQQIDEPAKIFFRKYQDLDKLNEGDKKTILALIDSLNKK